MNRYLFLVSLDVDSETLYVKKSLDAFHKITSPEITDPIARKVALQFDKDLGKEDGHAYQMMILRKQFNERLQGPYLLKTYHEVSRDILNEYISMLGPKEFSNFCKDVMI